MFQEQLVQIGRWPLEAIGIETFNPATVDGLMCRTLLSVGWDGILYDCDFNQMLEMPINHGLPRHIRDFDSFLLARRAIRTGTHCFGCTAGGGSSCTALWANPPTTSRKWRESVRLPRPNPRISFTTFKVKR